MNYAEQFESSSCDLTIEDYAYLVCRGGWPVCVGDNKKTALEHAYNFYEGLVEADINKFSKIDKNPQRVRNVIRSYSRGIAGEMSIEKIREDIMANDRSEISVNTISSYLDILKRLFIIEELPSWNINLRSKTRIRTSNVHHFVDPSIACAALEAGPEDMMNDLRNFGFLFESMCIRDLRVYAQKYNGKVFHYRDSRGLETDAIIHLRGGEWAAVEVKLASSDSIEEGADHLLKLRNDIDTSKSKLPSFLLVLTATSYAYRRTDGVYVVPIGCLRD